MARTDIHAPSRFQPADYDFVAYDYYGPSHGDVALSAHRTAFREHMAHTGGHYSTHEHGGTCHVCGAAAMYVAKFHHRPTNTYICTGMDCAEKVHVGDAAAFRRFHATVRSQLEAVAGKRKAQATLAQAGMSAAWDVYTSTPWAAFEEQTIGDIVGKLIKYGSISDKQMAFVGRLLTAKANRAVQAAERAAATAAAAPCPAGRQTVEGKVLSIKGQDTAFGYVTKMLVQHADGWKVWGTVAAAISAVEKGQTVRFVAEVTPSQDDPKFGFFARPSKAVIMNPQLVAA
jgi:hypothetical protein